MLVLLFKPMAINLESLLVVLALFPSFKDFYKDESLRIAASKVSKPKIPATEDETVYNEVLDKEQAIIDLIDYGSRNFNKAGI